MPIEKDWEKTSYVVHVTDDMHSKVIRTKNLQEYAIAMARLHKEACSIIAVFEYNFSSCYKHTKDGDIIAIANPELHKKICEEATFQCRQAFLQSERLCNNILNDAITQAFDDAKHNSQHSA